MRCDTVFTDMDDDWAPLYSKSFFLIKKAMTMRLKNDRDAVLIDSISYVRKHPVH